MIYLYLIEYSASWGPVPWVYLVDFHQLPCHVQLVCCFPCSKHDSYVQESLCSLDKSSNLSHLIFSTRLPSYGVGMGAAIQWLFNFVNTKITPEAVNHMG